MRLTKDDHTVTTDAPIEIVNLRAQGYEEVPEAPTTTKAPEPNIPTNSKEI